MDCEEYMVRYLLFPLLLFFGPVLTGQELEKLPATINDPETDEISPVLSSDGHTLFFTRVGSPDFVRDLWVDSTNVYESAPEEYDRVLRDAFSQLAGRQVSNPEQSDFNQDIWVAESRAGFFDSIFHPGWPLNNALPNSVCATTNQPNEYIVINRFPRAGGMEQGFSIIRRHRTGEFTFPEPLQINGYYTRSAGVNLALSADNEVLVLSIEQENSLGSNDLYMSFRLDNGNWGTPVHLPAPINSAYREITPTLSDDMKTLFFASDRPGGKGMDIYYCMRLDPTWLHWSKPQRLDWPVNSAADDSQPHFNAETGYLYFTSNRDGSSDLFRLKLRDAPEQNEVVVSGRILNTASGDPIDATVFFGEESSDLARSFYVSSDGYYRVKVPKGVKLPLYPKRSGFLGHREAVFFDPGTYYYQEHHLDLLLDPLVVDAEISMPPIFFEQSRAIIRQESYQSLHYLAELLRAHPELYIRIEGHTDNVGRKKDLLRLSEERAKAVRDFLVDQGIPRRRLDVEGFGDSRPVNANASDSDREANRRVEFRIVEIRD